MKPFKHSVCHTNQCSDDSTTNSYIKKGLQAAYPCNPVRERSKKKKTCATIC
ncbi:MAG TPA: hypothetical protein QF468_06255 [Nitrospinota bacterium]|nr:hypothetical protein [Nitrospinota bacterium]